MGIPPAGRAARPPLDAEYVQLLGSGDLTLLHTILPSDLVRLRSEFASPPIEDLIGDRSIRHETFVVAESSMEISVLTPANGRVRGFLLAVHGGGLVVGDRYTGIQFAFDWVDRLGLVVITPEYRLAPDHPYPAALSDVDHAYTWAVRYRASLGLNTLPLVLSGVSAGGTIASALALMLRDRGDALPAALILQGPMLDHRNNSVSSGQFTDTGQWDRKSNLTGWNAYLGGVSSDDVTAYMSPSLAADLTGFPPTFVDVGSAEVFRDEDVAFATALWAAGVDAQLVVWPGGVHGFDRIAPATNLALRAQTTRDDWLTRVIESH